jgi:hypothetical protein
MAGPEARSVPEMPVMPERSLRAPGPHDKTGRNARDHALQVGASGRGGVRPLRVSRGRAAGKRGPPAQRTNG